MHAFESTTGEKRKIFIVDDDQDAINVERMILEPAGYDVSVGSSSREALAELEHIRPDCIILDIMMPDMDGMELLQAIRERQEFRRTKIVMVSGKPYEYDKNRAFELGANGFVLKPFEPKEFLSTLETVIQDQIELQYWGVRGTLPRPGADALRYGGNTSCVTLSFADGRFLFSMRGQASNPCPIICSPRVEPESKARFSFPIPIGITSTRCRSLPRCSSRAMNSRFLAAPKAM